MDPVAIGRIVRRAGLGLAAVLAAGAAVSCEMAARGAPLNSVARARLLTECGYVGELETQLEQGPSDSVLQMALYNGSSDAKFWALAGTQVRDACSRAGTVGGAQALQYAQLSRQYRSSFALETVQPSSVRLTLDSARVTALGSDVCQGGNLNLITYFMEKDGRRRYFNGYALLTHGPDRVWRELDRGAAFFPGDFPSPTLRIIAFTSSSKWQAGGKYVLFSKDLPPPWPCPVVIPVPAP